MNSFILERPAVYDAVIVASVDTMKLMPLSYRRMFFAAVKFNLDEYLYNETDLAQEIADAVANSLRGATVSGEEERRARVENPAATSRRRVASPVGGFHQDRDFDDLNQLVPAEFSRELGIPEKSTFRALIDYVWENKAGVIAGSSMLAVCAVAYASPESIATIVQRGMLTPIVKDAVRSLLAKYPVTTTKGLLLRGALGVTLFASVNAMAVSADNARAVAEQYAARTPWETITRAYSETTVNLFANSKAFADSWWTGKITAGAIDTTAAKSVISGLATTTFLTGQETGSAVSTLMNMCKSGVGYIGTLAQYLPGATAAASLATGAISVAATTGQPVIDTFGGAATELGMRRLQEYYNDANVALMTNAMFTGLLVAGVDAMDLTRLVSKTSTQLQPSVSPPFRQEQLSVEATAAETFTSRIYRVGRSFLENLPVATISAAVSHLRS